MYFEVTGQRRGEHGGSVKTFVGPEKSPLAYRQVTQQHAADAHAFQTQNLQPEQFTHAADLALLAFAQDEAQLIFVLPGHPGRSERFAVEFEAMIEASTWQAANWPPPHPPT